MIRVVVLRRHRPVAAGKSSPSDRLRARRGQSAEIEGQSTTGRIAGLSSSRVIAVHSAEGSSIPPAGVPLAAIAGDGNDLDRILGPTPARPPCSGNNGPCGPAAPKRGQIDRVGCRTMGANNVHGEPNSQNGTAWKLQGDR